MTIYCLSFSSCLSIAFENASATLKKDSVFVSLLLFLPSDLLLFPNGRDTSVDLVALPF